MYVHQIKWHLADPGVFQSDYVVTAHGRFNAVVVDASEHLSQVHGIDTAGNEVTWTVYFEAWKADNPTEPCGEMEPIVSSKKPMVRVGQAIDKAAGILCAIVTP